jgi:hypothetical protein
VTSAYQAGRMLHQRKKMSAPSDTLPSGVHISSYSSAEQRDLAHIVVEES